MTDCGLYGHYTCSCDGWAQCSLCPRPDGTPLVPATVACVNDRQPRTRHHDHCRDDRYTKQHTFNDKRCPRNVDDDEPQRHPCGRRMPCCPPPGTNCASVRRCCEKQPVCLGEARGSCLEFLPNRCGSMPAVNGVPNLPMSGWSVLGWRPGPAAMRTCPKTQSPLAPCDLPVVVQPRSCERSCDARCLQPEPRCFTHRHRPDRLPLPHDFPTRSCNPRPSSPVYACSLIGSRRLTERINHKYSYPGVFASMHIS